VCTCYVLQHLVPLLDRPNSWDVLIAHYLGVDHAGHTYGVNSRHMEEKLAQMDDQVSTVIGKQQHGCCLAAAQDIVREQHMACESSGTPFQ
jgi:phosphatidylinositol glycan class O